VSVAAVIRSDAQPRRGIEPVGRDARHLDLAGDDPRLEIVEAGSEVVDEAAAVRESGGP
jgi:hypothetical protein